MRLSPGWVVVSLAVATACSAGKTASNAFQQSGNGGSGNGTGTGSTSGSGSTGSGTGGIQIFGGDGSAAAGATGDASLCQPIVSKPEQIVVYQDATVTDTIVTYSPIAIYIMQDRSGSMVTGFPTGSAQSWGYASTAISQFVNDPASAGLYVGLGSFPPYPGNVANNCSSDCNTPNVPIAALPGNASAISNAYTTLTPGALNFTPTECGLNGLAAACAAFEATSPGMPCVGLLITDGQPDACNTNVTTLSGILSTAAGQGIKTFVIGLNGVTDITFLNTLAQAGGTTSAIDLTKSNSSAAIVTALNTVRQKISTQTTSQTTTQTVISTKLPCEWKVASTITPGMTNLQYLSSPTAAPETLGHVSTDNVVNCPTTTNAWYYDSPTAPTKVTLCPSACSAVKAAPNPTMNLIFGCPTNEIIN